MLVTTVFAPEAGKRTVVAVSLGCVELLPFDEYVRSLNRKRMSAGVLFRDALGRVLLVEPSYKPYWDLPGGTVDADEAPWAAAVREVREEIGVDRRLGRLLVIDYVSTNERMPEGVAFVFDGGTITEAEVRSFVLTDPEIVSTGLFTVDEMCTKVNSELAGRIAVAAEVAEAGGLALCEDGRRVAR